MGWGTITSTVTHADVQVSVEGTEYKPATVVHMVGLREGEKDFLRGQIGDIWVMGGGEAADNGVVVAVRIAQIEAIAGGTVGRKCDIEQSPLLTTVYSICDIKEERFVCHPIFDDSDAALLLHDKEPTATVASMGDLYGEHQLVQDFLELQLWGHRTFIFRR